MTDPTSRLIIPGQPEPSPVGLTCQKCGGPMPDLDGELAAMARRAGGVTLVHAVCPGEEPAQQGRYFEVRCSIVEVTDKAAPLHDDDSDVLVEELASFKAGLRADDLEAAMRPLAAALGERWIAVEKQARIADPKAGQ